MRLILLIMVSIYMPEILAKQGEQKFLNVYFVCLVYFINSVTKNKRKSRESPEGGNDEA